MKQVASRLAALAVFTIAAVVLIAVSGPEAREVIAAALIVLFAVATVLTAVFMAGSGRGK